MLEALSLALVVGGIYILLLLLILQGWIFVWEQFLRHFDFFRELIGADFTAGVSDARTHRCTITSNCLNANRGLFTTKNPAFDEAVFRVERVERF